MERRARNRGVPRGVTALAGLALAAATVAVVPASAGGATSSCRTDWGSLPEQVPAMTASPVTNARAGRHDCFDRFVVDLGGPAAGYSVRYVDQLVADGSGEVVPLRGGAKLDVTVHAPAYDAKGKATYRPANKAEAVDVTGYRTFRQVRFVGSFEGYTQFGLGVRARLPFRVFVLAGPGSGGRVVVDVAHTW